jgi:antitoxin (DNA-binding transcriptional repressor) of toxin-antitoxin stability system
MKEVKVNEAKTNLSQLIAKLVSGEEREIVIFNGQKPVAKLTPYVSQTSAFGLFKGIEYRDDTFSSELVEEEFADYI